MSSSRAQRLLSPRLCGRPRELRLHTFGCSFILPWARPLFVKPFKKMCYHPFTRKANLDFVFHLKNGFNYGMKRKVLCPPAQGRFQEDTVWGWSNVSSVVGLLSFAASDVDTDSWPGATRGCFRPPLQPRGERGRYLRMRWGSSRLGGLQNQETHAPPGSRGDGQGHSEPALLLPAPAAPELPRWRLEGVRFEPGSQSPQLTGGFFRPVTSAVLNLRALCGGARGGPAWGEPGRRPQMRTVGGDRLG